MEHAFRASMRRNRVTPHCQYFCDVPSRSSGTLLWGMRLRLGTHVAMSSKTARKCALVACVQC
eukprot:scaffold299575_cov36-Tisochrysis_lutea.AAC.2